MELIDILYSKFSNRKGIISKKYIAKFLGEDPIIVEAGAHIGLDTCEIAKIWPKSKIFAFEPIPELFAQLVKNTYSFQNVKCFQMALGDKTGFCTINQSSGASDGSSSLLEPKAHLDYHPDVLFEKKIEVEVITLTDWMKINKIDRIDFFWLDLQGFELNVLKETKDILTKTKAIYTEVSIVENYSGGALYPELKKWLKTVGFIAKKEKIAWEDGGNVLFIK